MIKILISLGLIFTLVSCASNSRPEVEAIYFCRDKEFEYMFRIFEKYSIKRCMESSRIVNGRLMTSPMEKLASNCLRVINKQTARKKCCLINKTKKFGKVDLPNCRDGIID